MCLGCLAKFRVRLPNPLVRLVPASPSTGLAYWVFLDADGNAGASALMCDHEHGDKPRRPRVLATIRGIC